MKSIYWLQRSFSKEYEKLNRIVSHSHRKLDRYGKLTHVVLWMHFKYKSYSKHKKVNVLWFILNMSHKSCVLLGGMCMVKK